MTRHRTNAQKDARRAVAYIRESTEEQERGFSPAAQRDEIARFALDNGLNLIGEYFDLHSGWKGEAGKRPELRRLMADASDGNFEVVIVAHSSRFARNVADSRKYKALLRQTMKIDVVSATQRFGDDPEDPNAFLGEAISEVFDEHHSVLASFWMRIGLGNKRNQGYFVGNPPWGYRREPGSREIVIDAKPARLVRKVFEMYATGRYSYRDLAVWLTERGARTQTGALFSAEAVRCTIQNTTYIGYLGPRRDLSRETRGSWEPVIDEELFDRVQAVRESRARRGAGAGRPSGGYALSGLLRCERCGQAMHGSTTSANRIRSYICAGRKQGKVCDQPIANADAVEDQLAEYIRGFDPPAAVKKAIVRRLKAEAGVGKAAEERRTRERLLGRLKRLRDLYEFGDLSANEYLYKKQLLLNELEGLEPREVADLTKAAAALSSFGLFWERECDPRERNQLLQLVVHKVWCDGGRIAAVMPREGFLPYFQFGEAAVSKTRERRDSNPRPPA